MNSNKFETRIQYLKYQVLKEVAKEAIMKNKEKEQQKEENIDEKEKLLKEKEKKRTN